MPGGHPHGELKGETGEADKLASWLRRITGATEGKVTLQTLADRFGHGGKTKWGQYLDGRRIIPSEALRDLVTEYVPPLLRERRLAEGISLRNAALEAERSGRHKARLPAQRGHASSEELSTRLDDARKGQLQAQQAAFNAAQTVAALLGLVNLLQQRVDRLEAEKLKHTPGPGLQHELDESQDRLVKARELLADARREREKAEEIQLATEQMVAQHRRALADMEAALQDPEPEDTPADPEPSTSAEQLGLTPLYEVDHMLEVSGERIKEQAAELDGLSERLGLFHPVMEDEGPAVVRGELADNAANPATSETDEQDRLPALDSETPTAAPGEATEFRERNKTLAATLSRQLSERRYIAVVLALSMILSPAAFAIWFMIKETAEEARQASRLIYVSGNRPKLKTLETSGSSVSWPDAKTRVSTTFKPGRPLREGEETERIRGELKMSASDFLDPDAPADCTHDPKTYPNVDWKLTANGEPIATGQMKPARADGVHHFNVKLPSQTHAITFTAADVSGWSCGFTATLDTAIYLKSASWS